MNILRPFFNNTLHDIHSQIDFWLPLPVLLLLNLLSYLQVQKIQKRRENLKQAQRKEIEALKLFLPVVIVLLTTNIMPVAIFSVAFFAKVWYRELSFATALTGVVNAAVNFYIYYHQRSPFKTKAKALLFKWFGCGYLTSMRNVDGENRVENISTNQAASRSTKIRSYRWIIDNSIETVIQNITFCLFKSGPRSLPLLGNVLQLFKNPLQVLQYWAEKYGHVYSIRLGTQEYLKIFLTSNCNYLNTVVINDPNLVNELFSHINSTGRTFNAVTYYFGQGNGILNTDGHIWEAQRPFTVRKLREFGVLKSSNEKFLQQESEALIKFFERCVGKPISGTKLFNGPIINGLWRIVSGESCNWDSEVKPEIIKRTECLIEYVHRILKCTTLSSFPFVNLHCVLHFCRNINKASILFFAPFLRHIAPKFFGWCDWTNAVDGVVDLVKKSAEKHAKQLDPNNPQSCNLFTSRSHRDFIDEYLLKIQKTLIPLHHFFKKMEVIFERIWIYMLGSSLICTLSLNSVKNLEASVGDLIGAGPESISATLTFAILYLMHSDCSNGIRSCGWLFPSSDFKLPYIEAIILETLRLSSIAPLGFPHRMTADTLFHGYFLPKDVTVIAGLYTIHHNPKIWGEDVNEFRPERFISEDKLKVIHHKALLPFSVGKRACIGEGLAKDNLFLFIANILQRFDIGTDPVHPVTKIETVAGFTVESKPFNFVLNLRNQSERCSLLSHSKRLRSIESKDVLELKSFIHHLKTSKMPEILSIPQAVLAILTLLLVFLCFKKTKRDPRYPPGPISLPLLGNVLQLVRDPLGVLQKWAAKYGPVFSFKMGLQETIVVSDPKLVKELFSDIKSTGRASNPVTHYFGDGYGIINNDGRVWESQRRYTLRKLRDAGVFKSSIEGFIMEEAATLTNFFQQNVGKPISGIKLYNGPVVNALWRTISGESIDWAASEKPAILKRVCHMVEYVFQINMHLTSFNLSLIVFAFKLCVNRTADSGLFFASFLRHIAPGFFGWTNWVNSVDSFYELIDKAVEKHLENFDPNNPRDFIDNYLVEMQNSKDSTSNMDTGGNALILKNQLKNAVLFYVFILPLEKNLRAIVGDLFLAGAETVPPLSFATLYLIHNSDAQRKAQQEIDRVVGSRPISLSDKPLLPYTEAVLMETLRLSSITPLGVPHQMLADTVFHGFFLPKGATVLASQYGIHHDPKIWGNDVNEFRPERFLSVDKTHVVRHDALIPFSVGRRSCLGEGFAKDVIFLFVASILQKFNIKLDPTSPMVDIEPLFGVAIEPKPFKFVLSLRD
ncbi:Farnesoate epoxidase [Orchesella cincta]|uniref:Farnesoate epoxidase n=1 Tax=Orchesella cincta TaxID=48709 RepID=A0A1D2MHY1_ORCCI|nr:Farnesoate epoxidase [Orchesella cincta]